MRDHSKEADSVPAELWQNDAIGSLVEDQLRVPLFIVDPGNGLILWSNRAFAAMSGHTIEELRHTSVFDLHSPEDAGPARNLLHEIVRHGSASQVWRTRRKDGASLDVRVDARLVHHRGKDLVFATASSVGGGGQSDRYAADAEGNHNNRDYERLEVFNKILRTVSFSLDLEWMARKVSELAGGLIPHDRLSMTLVSPVRDVAVVYAVVGESAVLGRGTVLPLDTTSNAGEVVAGGRTVVRPDLLRETPFAEREPLLAAGIGSFVSTPLWSQGVCIGTLNIGSRHPGAYGVTEVRVAEEISANIGEIVARTRYFANIRELSQASPDTIDSPGTGSLSVRELQVLRLLAAGKRNTEIATQLALSPNSVKFHVANIFSKFGVHSRTEAALVAVRLGIVEIAPGLKRYAG